MWAVKKVIVTTGKYSADGKRHQMTRYFCGVETGKYGVYAIWGTKKEAKRYETEEEAKIAAKYHGKHMCQVVEVQ